jgi:hypothetical protein
MWRGRGCGVTFRVSERAVGVTEGKLFIGGARTKLRGKNKYPDLAVKIQKG